jgi:hypothetical protein
MPVGRSPTQLPTGLRPVPVSRTALWLARPDTAPVALHWPPPLADRSREMKPSNPSAVAKPLIAPRQSPVELTQAPSTQLVVCATFTVIVLVEKFAESMVPVHAPERSANGPAGAVGEGAPDIDPELEPPHAIATPARTIAPPKRTRLRTTKNAVSFASWSSPSRNETTFVASRLNRIRPIAERNPYGRRKSFRRVAAISAGSRR